MTNSDLGAFSEMFQDLASMFRLYGSEDQKAATLTAYFQTLQTYPLDRVRKGYEQIKITAQKWPVPAQWIAAMPRGDGNLPVMTWQQMKASDEAERQFYEGDPCECAECREAHASHLPLRYVPCLDRDGEVMPMAHPNRTRPSVLGRWIHGHELKRWYAAKAEFYQKLEATKPGLRKAMEVPA